MTVLVTGGAGYIGSHAANALLERGKKVVVLDNLSTGVRENVPNGAELVVGDLADSELLNSLIREKKIDSVLHFAGSIKVEESVSDPISYYHNNSFNTLRLLNAIRANGVKKIIFSSTAAVYGESQFEPLTEDAPTFPKSPYGKSKLFVEGLLQDSAVAYGLKYVALRYFNVIGVDPYLRFGYPLEKDPTHLVRSTLLRVRQSRRGLAVEPLPIYGTDYPTPDGTCIRDYIHVTDLAEAHVQALEYLDNGGDSAILNCGYGHGFSVLEVVEKVRAVSRIDIPVAVKAPRPGDPLVVVADASRARRLLNWEPKFDDLDLMIEHQLRWELSRNHT